MKKWKSKVRRQRSRKPIKNHSILEGNKVIKRRKFLENLEIFQMIQTVAQAMKKKRKKKRKINHKNHNNLTYRDLLGVLLIKDKVKVALGILTLPIN